MLNYDQVAALLLVMVRAATFLAVGPLFFFPGMPPLAKFGVGFLVSLLIFPSVALPEKLLEGGAWDYWTALLFEAVTGLMMGFISAMIFYSLNVAGQIMDIQMGFFMSTIFDPALGVQATIMSRFLYLLGMVLFLILNGHHVLIAGLVKSYDYIPLGGVMFKDLAALAGIRSFTQMVMLAVQIAAPVVATVFIVDICLGLLGRTAPEMNIFMLGFPVKIGIGIITLSVMVPLLGIVFKAIIEVMERDLHTLIKGLS